jgi:hypothetical protein
MTDDTCLGGRARKLLSPAYVAGIIDGEGSIFLRGRSPHISVSNTSQKLMDELAKFGGHLHSRQRNRSIGNLPAWDWVIHGEKAAIMLRACVPYLVIKQDKATAALLAWGTVTGTNHYYWATRARAEMLPLLDKAWFRTVRLAHDRDPAA